MKILLLGEYSNLHATLATALRDLGHEVRLVSDGDEWKCYPTDIRLSRRSTGLIDTLAYLLRLQREMRHWRGYDVVQLINPVHFVQLKAERGRRLYDWLRRHNRRIFLGAFGDDYYHIYNSYVRRPLPYSDFYTPSREVDHAWNRQNLDGWLHNKQMVRSCQHIARTCDGIIAALYEYYVAYQAEPDLKDKTVFIPLPVAVTEEGGRAPGSSDNSILSPPSGKLHIFIGIQRQRSALKGTDILLKVAQELQARYPDRMELVTAENLPFDQYTRLVSSCDILLDQIYSPTPAMNALQAMSRGIVALSGGEEEQYALLDEHELRPILNTQPEEDSVREVLEDIILHPERLPLLRQQSVQYVERHHEAHKVARQYLDFWSRH